MTAIDWLLTITNSAAAGLIVFLWFDRRVRADLHKAEMRKVVQWAERHVNAADERARKAENDCIRAIGEQARYAHQLADRRAEEFLSTMTKVYRGGVS